MQNELKRKRGDSSFLGVEKSPKKQTDYSKKNTEESLPQEIATLEALKTCYGLSSRLKTRLEDLQKDSKSDPVEKKEALTKACQAISWLQSGEAKLERYGNELWKECTSSVKPSYQEIVALVANIMQDSLQANRNSVAYQRTLYDLERETKERLKRASNKLS